MVSAVKDLGMEACVTLGMLTPAQAVRLSQAGLDFYNHNVGTSPEFYGKIISTRTLQDCIDTLAHVCVTRASRSAVAALLAWANASRTESVCSCCSPISPIIRRACRSTSGMKSQACQSMIRPNAPIQLVGSSDRDGPHHDAKERSPVVRRTTVYD